MSDKKKATVERYVLQKTLGSGYNSKVKLGLNPSTNKKYAVKLIKHSHPQLNLKVINKEVDVLMNLKHPNIVNLVEYKEDAEYVKKNGKKYSVVMIVMELIPNGEIFDFVSRAGRFPEKIARAYFRTLIETLDYCHQAGYAHRDLKPENLLLDEKFNLKVADFGFATLIAGKDGSGQLNSWLGSEPYMAPEIWNRTPYSGPCVDLFASAIILFILYAGNLPFNKADPKADPLYKLVAFKKTTAFWNFHEKSKVGEKPGNFFPDSFRNLIASMLALDPKERPTIEDIKKNEWYSGEYATMDEVVAEFNKINEEIMREAKAKEQAKEELKKASKGGSGYASGHQAYRSSVSELPDEDPSLESIKGLNLKAQREVEDYEGDGIMTEKEHKTPLSVHNTFKALALACYGVSKDGFEYSEEGYKVKGAVTKDNAAVAFKIKVTKISDNVSCVEFLKTKGIQTTFYEVIQSIKKGLPVYVEEGEKIEKKVEEIESKMEEVKIDN